VVWSPLSCQPLSFYSTVIIHTILLSTYLNTSIDSKNIIIGLFFLCRESQWFGFLSGTGGCLSTLLVFVLLSNLSVSYNTQPAVLSRGRIYVPGRLRLSRTTNLNCFHIVAVSIYRFPFTFPFSFIPSSCFLSFILFFFFFFKALLLS